MQLCADCCVQCAPRKTFRFSRLFRISPREYLKSALRQVKPVRAPLKPTDRRRVSRTHKKPALTHKSAIRTPLKLTRLLKNAFREPLNWTCS